MTRSARDPARFAALADAYGGDPARWPAADRTAAWSVMGEPWAAAILHDAGRLDDWLDCAAPVTASASLAARILADAPDRHTRLRGRPRWTWGLGFGATGLAGLCAGAAAMAAVLAPATTPDLHPRADPQTIFGDVAPFGDD
ncbi:MAG TPA: hypothetical protein VF649_01515 [Sphingomonas sp.]|jgi:hypothetical protein|uniref:hypothetical protein n=1 Tax=Sphingomonas sp. TaxID=28214 RepID=UPI002EDA980C